MAWKDEDLRIIESMVISTRIRLARNFASYPFPQKMDDAQAEDIVYLVEQGLKNLDNFKKYDMRALSEEEATSLQEKYLISPALIRSKRGAAFVDEENVTSIMVNEEDHLREQYICKGFNLCKAYERISAIDDELGRQFDFAFDEKLGYLTACPSNLGTGMRASVMMFLPGLVWNGELKKILPTLKKGGLTVRGEFGEGTSAEGYVYQISNERTLGMSEGDILEQMEEVTYNLCELEIRAREDMLQTAKPEIKDRCLRSYGTLTNCGILSQKEFLTKMGDVKLGIMLGFLETDEMTDIQDFIDGMRPTVFKMSNGLQGATQKECDIVRAETVYRVLPELVRVVRK